jgi:hypothetical protein
MKTHQETFHWAIPVDYPIDDLERVIPMLQETDFLLQSFNLPELGLYHPVASYRLTFPLRSLGKVTGEFSRGDC